MYLPLSSLPKICGVPTYRSFHCSETEVSKANVTSKTLIEINLKLLRVEQNLSSFQARLLTLMVSAHILSEKKQFI